MKKFVFITFFSVLFSFSGMSQAVINGANDFKVRLMGRTHVDYGFFSSSDSSAYDGVGAQINDTRLGVQATIDKNWSAKMEVAYANKAVSFKDVWVAYKWNDQTLCMGNQFQLHGMLYLGLAYRFINTASTDALFAPARKIGITYSRSVDHLNVAGGVFSDADVNANSDATTERMDQGMALVAKVIWRPIANFSDGDILHIGVSPLFVKSDKKVTLKTVMPSTILAEPLNKMVMAGDDVIDYIKSEAEVIYMKGKLYAEVHYMRADYNLVGSENYSAYGCYAQAAFLLKGTKHNYNKVTGLPQNPDPKSLEVVARFCYNNLDEAGSMKDFTVGMNYVINKNLITRLNYVHANIDNGKTAGYDGSVEMVQARMQFSF